jgi:hypothetical protein
MSRKKEDRPHMKNDIMEAIPESLDHDLAFEAADVMIDEARIMNGQAFISGTQLLEHRSNLSQWLYPHPLNLLAVLKFILHLVTHISHWSCATPSVMVLSSKRIPFRSFPIASAR